jgi:hypothetical protein
LLSLETSLLSAIAERFTALMERTMLVTPAATEMLI